jgi:hypothetical protein
VGVGKGGEMTQAMYAYMNKIKIKKKENCSLCNGGNIIIFGIF